MASLIASLSKIARTLHLKGKKKSRFAIAILLELKLFCEQLILDVVQKNLPGGRRQQREVITKLLLINLTWHKFFMEHTSQLLSPGHSNCKSSYCIRYTVDNTSCKHFLKGKKKKASVANNNWAIIWLNWETNTSHACWAVEHQLKGSV